MLTEAAGLLPAGCRISAGSPARAARDRSRRSSATVAASTPNRSSTCWSLAVALRRRQARDRYQLLLGLRPRAAGELEHATIGARSAARAPTTPCRPRLTARCSTAIRGRAHVGDVRFCPSPAWSSPPRRAGRVLGAEQTNTSLVFGDRHPQAVPPAHPGVNPDLELHRALRSGGQHAHRRAARRDRGRPRRRADARSASCRSSRQLRRRLGDGLRQRPGPARRGTTCTPTRWAATSPARRAGSAWRSRGPPRAGRGARHRPSATAAEARRRAGTRRLDARSARCPSSRRTPTRSRARLRRGRRR